MPLVGAIAMGGSHFHSKLASWIFDAIFWLNTDFGPTRRLMDWGVFVLSRRRLIAAVEAFAPDVVVSTYPGATLVLGELRARGRLRVPVVSAITDLAALRVVDAPGHRREPDHPPGIERRGARAGPGERDPRGQRLHLTRLRPRAWTRRARGRRSGSRPTGP